MPTYGNIQEEELKNKVARDYFADYDSTQIIGKIDFCIAVPQDESELFETESLLWAEAKTSTKKDIIQGKNLSETQSTLDLFNQSEKNVTARILRFSPEAQAVMDAGRELWRYYHAQPDADPNAALYDIRLHFQGTNAKGKMNTDSDDSNYMELITDLRQKLKLLARKIEPKVYEYGFLLQ